MSPILLMLFDLVWKLILHIKQITSTSYKCGGYKIFYLGGQNYLA